MSKKLTKKELKAQEALKAKEAIKSSEELTNKQPYLKASLA